MTDPAAPVSAGRPVYHFIAPRGWMNDPCAPGYDAKTGLYHLFYQWSPHTHKWDRISWGHATSKDLLHWTHSSPDTPVLAPDTPYDREGVFTGCFWPTGPRGEEDQLCVFYTNVDSLPLHWTIPYTRGCEGLAMAVSRDRGKTWEKWADNPVLKEEPADLSVSGFRDPYLAKWPAMDAARGKEEGGRLYGLISGGIKGVGPRTFLYEVDPADLTKWSYLHPLLRVPENHYPSGRWGGDMGINLECTNFLTLTSDGELERQVIVTGTEGGKARPNASGAGSSAPERVTRYGPWLMGNLEKAEDGEIDMAVTASGMVDWAELYAYNTFKHADGRTLMWGWLIEEDLTDAALEVKSWTGCMGVPREVFLATYHGVKGALSSKLEDVGSFEILSTDPEGVHSVATLGIRPLRELASLQGAQLYHTAEFEDDRLLVSSAPLASKLDATIAITPQTEEVSLCIRHSVDYSTATRISFYPKRETLVVHRDASNSDPNINKETEEGAFTLLRTVDGLEALRLQVFLDHDTIEVFANDRFSLSTRVYSAASATGISYSSRAGARVESLSLWEMTATQ